MLKSICGCQNYTIKIWYKHIELTHVILILYLMNNDESKFMFPDEVDTYIYIYIYIYIYGIKHGTKIMQLTLI